MVFNFSSLLFDQFSARMFRSEKINTHGGSIRVYIKKDKRVRIENSVKKMLKEEEKFGIKDFKTYQKFGKKYIELGRMF